MHYKADINSMDMLKRIVMRLPPPLQTKWAEESDKLIGAEKEPEFSHLENFVQRSATVANTVFGNLVGWRPSVDPPASVTSLGIQSANGVRPPGVSIGQPALSPVVQGSSKQVASHSCLFCNGTHSLEDALSSKTRPLTNEKSLCQPGNCVPTARE